MKHHRLLSLLATCLAASAATTASAQLVQAGGLSPFAKDYQIDFAIPDAPAMKLLDETGSAILRPQTVRDLSVALAGFRGSNNTFVVPKQLGVELSPGLLIGNNTLTVSDYNTKKYLYATRFSGATGRDSLNRARLAAGIRFSLVDEQDLRSKGAGGTDTVLTRITAAVLSVYDGARDRVGPRAPLALTDAEKTRVSTLSDSIKQYWANKYWNANSLELAFGARAGAADSLGHNPQMQELAAWLSYANGLQGWGQLLLGAKFGSARDTTNAFQGTSTLGARLYIGANTLKTFVEGQHALASKTDAKWLANAGVEFRLSSIGWITASAGYETSPDGGKGRLISSFKFNAGAPK